MMEGRIELSGMEFFARHGCLEKEREDGNVFMVDFACNCDISAAVESDRLEDTINYGEVYEIVAAHMQNPVSLLETVAGRILSDIAARFPQAYDIEVKVSKKNPPVDGAAQWSSVTARQK